MGKISFFLFAIAIFRLAGHFTDPRLTTEQIHQVVGEASGMPTITTERPLRVATWNIEHGTQFGNISEELVRIDADVLLLQEVDMFCRRSGNRHVARDLAAVLHMNWVFAGEFQEIGESTGNVAALTGQAVLSRFPITDASSLVFDTQAKLRWKLSPIQPRRGGRMTLVGRTAGIRLYNTHIESGGDDELRKRQLDEILQAQARSVRSDEPVMIAGDFNNPPQATSMMFKGLTAERFIDALGRDPERVTSIRHHYPIDWIFLRNLTAEEGYVVQTRQASDHYALVTKLHPVGGSVTTEWRLRVPAGE
jgi:endonuclease/exonuclease/phosphatase family metal-dependent hydrolase